MKKIFYLFLTRVFFLLIIFGFGFGLIFAQMDRNIPNNQSPQAPSVTNFQVDPNQSSNTVTDQTPLQDNPEFVPSAQGQPLPPGGGYCIAILGDSSLVNLSACVSCLQGGGFYSASGGCNNDVCADSACQEKLGQCLDSGGSPDRCLCKAVGGISLNTNVPFVGNCIALRSSPSSNTTTVKPTTAFPLLMAGLTRIVMTVILVFCFMAIIVGGVLISMGGADEAQAKKGKDLIKHVVIALALLGASGVILRAINPNFFG